MQASGLKGASCKTVRHPAAKVYLMLLRRWRDFTAMGLCHLGTGWNAVEFYDDDGKLLKKWSPSQRLCIRRPESYAVP